MLMLNIWGILWENANTLAELLLTKGEEQACSIQGWNILEQFYPRDHPVLPKAIMKQGCQMDLNTYLNS